MAHVVVLNENVLLALLRGTTIYYTTTKGEKVILTNKEDYVKFYKEEDRR